MEWVRIEPRLVAAYLDAGRHAWRDVREHADRMGRTASGSDVPEDVHRIVKAWAAEAGVSLSESVRQELARVATRPPQAELARRLRSRTPVDLGGMTSADVTR
jgi:hypothetical protein